MRIVHLPCLACAMIIGNSLRLDYTGNDKPNREFPGAADALPDPTTPQPPVHARLERARSGKIA